METWLREGPTALCDWKQIKVQTVWNEYSHDILPLTVETSASASWAEKATIEINNANTGSIRICFVLVIGYIAETSVSSHADM